MLQHIELSKTERGQSTAVKWVYDLKDILTSTFVEKTELTLFEKFRLKFKKKKDKPLTLFEKRAKRRKEK